MPRYDLSCQSCGHIVLDVARGINQDNPPCPKCGKDMQTLPPTGTGFVLRGSGWAASGYSKETKR